MSPARCADDPLCYVRLDVILGKAGSKKPDEYVSKISLASRVVKVERSVSSARGRVGAVRGGEGWGQGGARVRWGQGGGGV